MTAGEGSTIGSIWAQAHGRVIGSEGGMPWHVPEDMAFFRRTTMGHPVIMGRRTWESIPDPYRPFSGRTNIVISSQESFEPSGALRAPSLNEALALAAAAEGSEEIWIVGGGRVYAEAMGVIERVFLTQLDLDADGDTRAPALGDDWTLVEADPAQGWNESRTGIRYRIEEYTRSV